MSSTDLKHALKVVQGLFDDIPQRLRRNIELKRHLWLTPDGIQVGVGRGRKRYAVPTFFNSESYTALTNEEKRDIVERLRDYTLLRKLKRKTLEARDILICKNAELRQYLLHEYGFEKFMQEMRGTLLHQDGSSKLIMIRLEGQEDLKAVRVKDSTTGQYYLLRVPPEVKTCKEAVAWTFGMSAEEYNPIKET